MTVVKKQQIRGSLTYTLECVNTESRQGFKFNKPYLITFLTQKYHTITWLF